MSKYKELIAEWAKEQGLKLGRKTINPFYAILHLGSNLEMNGIDGYVPVMFSRTRHVPQVVK